MDKLANGKVGSFYKIKGIDIAAPLKIKRRILELGFTLGQALKLARKSLLGKAFLVEIRGYTLTIRKDIAQYILI